MFKLRTTSLSYDDEEYSDFIYELKQDYICDFDKYPEIIFRNFYLHSTEEVRDLLPFTKVIGDLVNNLPQELVMELSVVDVSFKPATRHIVYGFNWSAACMPGLREIHINESEYYNQYQYLSEVTYNRVLIHEYIHYLLSISLIPEDVMIDLWYADPEVERVSEQAYESPEENCCEIFAAFLMALGSEGDTEYNADIRFFENEYPTSYEIIKKYIETFGGY